MPMHHTLDRNLNTLSNVTNTTCTTKNSNMTATITTIQDQPQHTCLKQQQKETPPRPNQTNVNLHPI
jgi:hypothetical protein